MRKTTKRFLALVLLAAVLLTSGSMALAAASPSGKDAKRGEDPEDPEAMESQIPSEPRYMPEDADPEDYSGEPVEAEGPLPTILGFDFRNVTVTMTPEANSFTIIIFDAKEKEGEKEVRFGIAAYDSSTKKASPIPGQNWAKPGADSTVVFKNVYSTSVIVTSIYADSSTTKTPAQRFNDDNIGLPFIMPAPSAYNLMEPVDEKEETRAGNEIMIHDTDKNREYGLYNSNKGEMVTSWQRGNGGNLTFVFGSYPPSEIMAVSRIAESVLPYIVPVIPPVEPGADPARTKLGFSLRTAMAVLTLETTVGMEYAIADENGHILNRQERLRWGITAETEQEFNVMPDATNFYPTPGRGSQIRFRVPPGGKYFVVTRLPNGLTATTETPYQSVSVGKNLKYLGHFWDRYEKRWYGHYEIQPASVYSYYAVINKDRGIVEGVYAAKDGMVKFRTTMPMEAVLVQGVPIPLHPGENSQTGQASPAQKIYPPVLSRTLEGAGRTSGGQTILVGPWSPEGTPFAKDDAAVVDALNAPILRGLDPSGFIGALLASITVENRPDPLTLVVFLDENRSPNPALYYDGKNWSLASLTGGDYLMDFDLEGQEGTVILFETDANAA